MSNLLSIRRRLGLNQVELGKVIGCTKSRVSQIEKRPDDDISPDAARKLVAYAAEQGVSVTYDDIYGAAEPAGAAA